MTSHRTLPAQLIALVLVGLLAVGCTGGDAADAPALSTVDGDGFTIGVPPEWEASEEGEQLVPGRMLEYLPAGSFEPGTVPPQIGVALDQGGENGPIGSLDGYIALLFGAGSALSGQSVEVTERREVEFEGAEEAMRVEVTHPAGDTTARMMVLLVRTADGPIWDVRYGAADGDFDEALADAVLESFDLRQSA